MSDASYFVYLIQSKTRFYIGATVDPTKRLRQHNGEIAGGARRTHNRGPWHYECVISGFRTWKEALQYEWAAKYYSKLCRGVVSKRAAIETLNSRDKWTSNSPPASEVSLSVEYSPSKYGFPSHTYAPVASLPRVVKRSTRFKKRIAGVSY